MHNLLNVIVGSHAYGTNIPESDIDRKSIHIAYKEDFLADRFKEQIDFDKDTVSYEISRYLQLLNSANPTMLEMLYIPEDCITLINEDFKDVIVSRRDMFLTKQVRNSYGGYAIAQIKKARGLNKKMHWEEERVIRRQPRDFCYVTELHCEETYKFTEMFKEESHNEFAVTKANHIADGYFLWKKEQCSSFYPVNSENGNSLKCSSVMKDEIPVAFLYYNKSEYSKHCAEYKSYQTWLKERNTQRYVDIKNHNQMIDGKNMLHCVRLLDTAIDIFEKGELLVRRENAKDLIAIRRGEVDLDRILKESEEKIILLDELVEKSDLPDSVDTYTTSNMLMEIRKRIYNI